MVVNRIVKDGKNIIGLSNSLFGHEKKQQKTETNPLLILRQAILRITPTIGVTRSD